MLNCSHILAIVRLAQRQQSNLKTPPNVWHKNQDRIKNVELYTLFEIVPSPPSGPDRAQRQQSTKMFGMKIMIESYV